MEMGLAPFAPAGMARMAMALIFNRQLDGIKGGLKLALNTFGDGLSHSNVHLNLLGLWRGRFKMPGRPSQRLT